MLNLPPDFPRLRSLSERARGRGPLRVGVVYPCEAGALAAALEACERGFIDPVLIGPRTLILALAGAGGLDVSRFAIVEADDALAAARCAVAMAGAGEIDALMKGSLHTDELLGAVVARDSPLKTGRRISHVFWFDCPAYHKPLMLTDAVINIAPGLVEKADIVRNAIGLAHALGIAIPKVAILAATETVNAAIPSTIDAAALCKMAERGQITGAVLDGPLGFDNAISATAASIKSILSPVAGDPDILVVPGLDAGNSLYKSIVYMGGAACAGLVLGARVPIILTSRSDSERARVASCALAALTAPARATLKQFAGRHVRAPSPGRGRRLGGRARRPRELRERGPRGHGGWSPRDRRAAEAIERSGPSFGYGARGPGGRVPDRRALNLSMDHAPESSPALKAFSLLETIANMDHAPTLAELTDATSLPKPTLHRWIAMLEGAAMVQRLPDGRRYELAARATALALSILWNNPESTQRHQILQRLAGELGESCNLTILQGSEVLYLDRAEATLPLRVAFQKGSRVPIHCSASGKMFLAMMSPAKRARCMEGLSFDQHTRNTLPDRAALEAELATIRLQGHAFDDEEFLSGLFCIAVPIFDAAKRTCLAGLALQAPVVRVCRANAAERLAPLHAAATALATTLQ